MRNCVIGICVIVFLMYFNIGTQNAYAVERDDNFLANEEAVRIGNGFLSDFTQIVREGSIEQYQGTWAYDVLIEWRDVLNEMGTYYGISDTRATVDSEKAIIIIKAEGSRRNAVIEFTLYFDQIPDVVIYSKFSLTKWLTATEAGAVLLIINSLAIIALFVLYAKKPKTLPAAERNQAIDDTIAQIIRNEEENGKKEEVTETDGEPEDKDAG